MSILSGSLRRVVLDHTELGFFASLAYGDCRNLPHILYMWKVNSEKKFATTNSVYSLSRSNKKMKSKPIQSVDKSKKFWYYRGKIKKIVLQVYGVCVVPKKRYSSKWSVQNYRAQYGAAMLEDLLSPPIWRPELTSVWNLLRLCSRLIMWTEP